MAVPANRRIPSFLFWLLRLLDCRSGRAVRLNWTVGDVDLLGRWFWLHRTKVCANADGQLPAARVAGCQGVRVSLVRHRQRDRQPWAFNVGADRETSERGSEAIRGATFPAPRHAFLLPACEWKEKWASESTSCNILLCICTSFDTVDIPRLKITVFLSCREENRLHGRASVLVRGSG